MKTPRRDYFCLWRGSFSHLRQTVSIHMLQYSIPLLYSKDGMQVEQGLWLWVWQQMFLKIEKVEAVMKAAASAAAAAKAGRQPAAARRAQPLAHGPACSSTVSKHRARACPRVRLEPWCR
jgi:hypothetical protein